MEPVGPLPALDFEAIRAAGQLIVKNDDGLAWRLAPFQLAFECPSDGLDLLVRRVSAFATAIAGILTVLTLSGIAPLPLFGFALLWAGGSALGLIWARRHRRRFGQTVIDFESNTYAHQPTRLAPDAGSMQHVRITVPGDGPEDPSVRVWLSLVNATGQEIRLVRAPRNELRMLVTIFRTYGCSVESGQAP